MSKGQNDFSKGRQKQVGKDQGVTAKGVFAPRRGVKEVSLRRSGKLIRHAAIRRLLSGRYHADGIRNLDHLKETLEATTGISVNRMTLSYDLREMGAIKVRDAERPEVEWYVLPAFNPNVEDLRAEMDPTLIEAEVAHKFASHVYDMAPINNLIYVMTESRAGPLVAYWLSWLSWDGIIMVQEQLDSAIIHCVNGATASSIASRLIGRSHDDREEGEDGSEGKDDENGDASPG